MPEVLAIRSSADPRLPDERLERVLFNAFSEVWPDIDRREITAAVEAGISRLNDFESDMRAQGTRALRRVRELNARAVVLAGRPYHVDPAVHHGIPDLLRSCGYGVLTDDSLPGVPTGGAVLPRRRFWGGSTRACPRRRKLRGGKRRRRSGRAVFVRVRHRRRHDGCGQRRDAGARRRVRGAQNRRNGRPGGDAHSHTVDEGRARWRVGCAEPLTVDAVERMGKMNAGFARVDHVVPFPSEWHGSFIEAAARARASS